MKNSSTRAFYLPRVLLIVIFSGFLMKSNAQMRQVYLDNVADYQINKISFFSPSSGYVAFRDFIGYTSDSGHTLIKKYITNSNVNYNGNSVNLTFGFSISGVKGFNQNTFIVYGDYGYVPAILYTNNGGSSYNLVYHSQLGFVPIGSITDMVFPQNTGIGYAIDYDRILKTTDGGLNWNVIRTDIQSAFDKIESVDDNNIIVMSTYPTINKILKTSNGGNSWQPVFLPILPNGKFYYCYFLTAAIGWVNMYDSNQKQYLFKTSNGGSSWVLVNNIEATPFACTKFKFIDNNVGFALDFGFTVLKTTNGGAVWEPLPRDNNYLYFAYGHNDLHFLNTNQFWAGGGHGFLELNTNLSGPTLPKAFFRIDTIGLGGTGNVQLLNYSNPSYLSKWYANNVLVGTTYNSSYVHNIYSGFDSVKLVVSNGSFSDSVTLYQGYNAVPLPPTSSITSFRPLVGYSGVIDSIYGTNLTTTTAVTFGGTPAVSYTVVSPTLITAVLGAGSTGNVSVTTSYGTVTAPNFTYITRLKITSFSPATGAPGTPVIINGSNFSTSATANIVYFGAVKASVVSVTTNQLIVTAPYGTSHSPISVTTSGLTAYSALPFITTFIGGCTLLPATFANRIDSSGELSEKALDQADFDGDGKIDLIIQDDAYYNRFSIYRNTSVTSNISFASKQYIAVPHCTQGIFAIGDLNGDGKPDLVTANLCTGGFSVFLNTSIPGIISFGVENLFGNAYALDPNFIKIADMDGDGRPDVLGVKFDKVHVFKNLSTTGNLAFDVSDLFYPYSTGGGETWGFSVTDIDLDGLPDAVVNCNYYSEPSIKILRNITTNGTIKLTQSAAISNISLGSNQSSNKLATADFDGDGKPDFAVLQNANGSSSGLYPFRNTSVPGSISFAAQPIILLTPFLNDISAGDVNGDGKPDVIITYIYTNDISIMINTSVNGNISFGPPITFGRAPFGTFGKALVGDINLDGKSDITVLAQRSNLQTAESESCLSIFKNNFCGQDTITICSNASTGITCNIPGSSFQWQQDQGSGFVNISNNGNFSGTTSLTLILNNIPTSFSSYKYRCVVNGNYSSETTVNVNANVVPSVSVTSSAISICQGTTVTFTAMPLNGGNTPMYQWQINGVNAGSNSNTFSTATLTNNAVVRVILTSSAQCSAPQAASSNDIIITVTPTPVASVSISIAASQNNICAGSFVTFTATPLNGGTIPGYQWQVNGVKVGANSNTFTTNTLANNAQVKCILTSNAACVGTATVNSNTITMNVNASVTPTIVINTVTLTICPGNAINFTATTTGGGNAPTYQWQVNGINVGTNASTFSLSTLTNNDQIKCILTSNALCATTSTVTSNIITVVVTTSVTATVSIITNSGAICSGTSVTFTATPTNAGPSPTYQWKVNGINAGTNNPTFTSSSLQSNDQITVVMTSSLACAAPASATSNAITMSVTASPIANAGIDVSICAGSSTQLTGSGGASYSWTPPTGLSNANIANPIATPSSSTWYVLTVSNGSCTSFDTVRVIVQQPAAPTVSINTPSNNICSGSNATFTAVALNAGTNPIYQWQVNGVNEGTNSATFSSSSLENNAQVKVIVTSSGCTTTPVITSNVITMSLTTLAQPIVSLNTNVLTVTNADAAAVYTWQVLASTIWNNVIPTATGGTYTITQPGEYRVKAEKAECTLYSASLVSARANTFDSTLYYIYLSPNPARGVITVSKIVPSQNWQSIEVINLQGATVLPSIDIRGLRTVSINVLTLAPGIYFIRLTNDTGKKLTYRFIKE